MIALSDLIADRAKELGIRIHADHLPTMPPGLEALAGRKIVLVDDGLDVVAAFLVPLMMVTEGEAEFVLQNTQSMDQTIDEILEKDPEIVLLDEYLRGLRGHQLIGPLLQKKPGLICLGFSNAESTEKIFLESGAKGFVFKEQTDPWRTLEHVVRLI